MWSWRPDVIIFTVIEKVKKKVSQEVQKYYVALNVFSTYANVSETFP